MLVLVYDRETADPFGGNSRTHLIDCSLRGFSTNNQTLRWLDRRYLIPQTVLYQPQLLYLIIRPSLRQDVEIRLVKRKLLLLLTLQLHLRVLFL